MRYLCNKCETTMKENLSDPISWKSKGIVIISLHWESNHFFPRKLLRLLDFVSCSSPMSMSFISSCLSFLVCLKAFDFKVAISKGATAAASEWSLGQGFCVLNVLSTLSNFLSWEKLTKKRLKMASGETICWSYEGSPLLGIFLCVKMPNYVDG